MTDRPPPTWDRRQMLDGCLGICLTCVAGSVAYPIAAYLAPSDTTDAGTGDVVAGRVDEMPPNSWKIFRFGSRPGLLLRTASGEFRAFAATCTHLNCTVQYRPDEQIILCACHRGMFDLTGKNIAGPPPRPLEAYAVRVQGQDVVVSRVT